MQGAEQETKTLDIQCFFLAFYLIRKQENIDRAKRALSFMI